MRSTIAKNINLCFTQIVRPRSPESSPQQDQNRPSSTSTTSTLIKNFNSLYDSTLDCSTIPKSFPLSTTTTTTSASGDLSTSESDDETATTPDFSTVFASSRFFFSSPGRSNSIVDSSSMSSSVESTSSSSPENPPESETLVGDSVAVPTYSTDPYTDFRRSMQEMVEKQQLIDVRANWDYLNDLLLCYLRLNPKNTHKFIVGAFADLLVSLMASSAKDDDIQKLIFGDDCCDISGSNM